jgi:hypothetical protein
MNLIAATPDSRAKTILEVYWGTGMWIDHDEDEKKEVKELLLWAMGKEVEGLKRRRVFT